MLREGVKNKVLNSKPTHPPRHAEDLTPSHPLLRILSSTVSGFKEALLDVTVFSATENKIPDFELTAGNGKTTLVSKLLLSAIN